jgi:hypothetical protein
MLRSARAEVAIQHGELDIAERELARARQAAGSTGDSMHFWALTDRPALLALLRGDPDEAATTVEAAVSRMSGDELVMYTGRSYAIGLRAHADRAIRARSLREHRTAADAAEAGEALLARFRGLLAPDRWIDSPPPEPVAYLALAAAEHMRLRGANDPATWDTVAGHWTQLAYPLELSYTRFRQAEAALAAGGTKAVAERLLQEAAEIAMSTGARWLAEEIAGLARSARIELASGSETGTARRSRPSGLGSRIASSKYSRCSRTADPTPKSQTPCSSRRRPRAPTSPTSSRSST